MKTSSKLWLAGGLTAALVGLAGCSGSSGDGDANVGGGPQGDSGPAAATTTVPDSAGSTVAAFMAYVIGMDPNDEKSEPLIMKDSFAVPVDETSDSQPIG